MERVLEADYSRFSCFIAMNATHPVEILARIIPTGKLRLRVWSA